MPILPRLKLILKKTLAILLCWGQILTPTLSQAHPGDEKEKKLITIKRVYKASLKLNESQSSLPPCYCHPVKKTSDGVYSLVIGENLFNDRLDQENLSLFLTDKDKVVGKLLYSSHSLHLEGFDHNNFSLEPMTSGKNKATSYVFPKFTANVKGHLTLKGGEFSQEVSLKAKRLLLKGDLKVRQILKAESEEETLLQDYIKASEFSIVRGKKCVLDGRLEAGNIFVLFPRPVKREEKVFVGRVNFKSTKYVSKTEEIDGMIKVTTDRNDKSTYQLTSDRLSVIPGETITIPYRVRVEAGGQISLGLLNTTRQGWYSNEWEQQQVFLGPGLHTGIFKRIVPSGERETTLVFRNAHLKTPGQSTFTIESVDLQKDPALPLKKACQSMAASQNTVTESQGSYRVTTDRNKYGLYQLESDRFRVVPGETLKIPYGVTVQRGGQISLGFLNTKRNNWYGAQLFLSPGHHVGFLERIVPPGETETSLVFRNAHLKTPGQSIFTVDYVGIQKQPFPFFPLPLKKAHQSMAAFDNEVTEDKGMYKVRTDCNNSCLYQLESDRFQVLPGEIIKIPYTLTIEKGGRLSLGLLNTKRNNWYGAQLFLSSGRHVRFLERIVPPGERETSLVFRNAHGTPHQTTFTVEYIGFRKEVLPRSAPPKPKNVFGQGLLSLDSTFGSGRAKGKATKIEKGNKSIKVTTDKNAHASYQLESYRFPVKPGEKVKIPYEIIVEAGGKMSLGLLRTDTKGWYGKELVLNAGVHRGFYERIVPQGEKEASLVLRNAQKNPAQTIFTIKKIDIFTLQKIEIPKAIKRGTGPRSLPGWQLHDVEDVGNCFYEAIVHQMERIKHPFLKDIPKGTLPHDSLRRCIQGENFRDREWAEDQHIDEFVRKFDLILAIIDTRNPTAGYIYYYLGEDGEIITHVPDHKSPLPSKGIIKLAATGDHFLSVLSEGQPSQGGAGHRPNETGISKALNFDPTFGSGRAEGKAIEIERENKTIKVTTDRNAQASYQLESERFFVKPGEKIQVPYEITVNAGGKMSLGLLRTDTKGWYGKELFLNAGTHKGFYERIVPQGEREASLVFRNAHYGTPGQTTFIIKKIGILREGGAKPLCIVPKVVYLPPQEASSPPVQSSGVREGTFEVTSRGQLKGNLRVRHAALVEVKAKGKIDSPDFCFIEAQTNYQNKGRVVSQKGMQLKLGGDYVLGTTYGKENLTLEVASFSSLDQLLTGSHLSTSSNNCYPTEAFHLLTKQKVCLTALLPQMPWGFYLTAPSIQIKKPLSSKKDISLWSTKNHLTIEADLNGQTLSLRSKEKLTIWDVLLYASKRNIEVEAGFLYALGTQFRASGGEIALHPHGPLLLRARQISQEKSEGKPPQKKHKGKTPQKKHTSKKTRTTTTTDYKRVVLSGRSASLHSFHGVGLVGVTVDVTHNINILSQLSPLAGKASGHDGCLYGGTVHKVIKEEKIKEKNGTQHKKPVSLKIYPLPNTFKSKEGGIYFEGAKKVELQAPELRSQRPPIIKSATEIKITTHFEYSHDYSKNTKTRKIGWIKIGKKTKIKTKEDKTNQSLTMKGELEIKAPKMKIELPINDPNKAYQKKKKEKEKCESQISSHEGKIKASEKKAKNAKRAYTKRICNNTINDEKEEITKCTKELTTINQQLKVFDAPRREFALDEAKKTPGLTWVQEYRKDPRIRWVPIDDEHKKCQKTYRTLSKGIGALINCVVTLGFSLTPIGPGGCALLSTLTSSFATKLIETGDFNKALNALTSKKTWRLVATNFLTAEITQALSAGLEISTTPTTFLGHLQYNALRAGVSGGLSMAILKTDLSDALLHVMTSTASGTLGGWGANQLAGLGDFLNFFEHKLAHGVLGAGMGAILSPRHPFRGVLPGFIGGALSEIIAEGTVGSLGRRTAGNLGLLGASTMALLLNQDVDIANTTASNAINNNLGFAAAIPYILTTLAAAGTTWTAYDIYATYQQHGLEAALERARDEVIVIAATGAAGKVTYKIGKTVYPTAQAAWKAYVKTNPQLLEMVEKGAQSLGKVERGKLKSQFDQASFSNPTHLTTERWVKAEPIDADVIWGKGIREQGGPWEDYLASQLPPGSRLHQNYKTFDFHDRVYTQDAISAKTLNTMTNSKISNPNQLYYSLKRNIDAAEKFEKHTLDKVTLTSEKITFREVRVAIPSDVTPAQLEQLKRAMNYGQSKNINLIITKVKK